MAMLGKNNPVNPSHPTPFKSTSLYLLDLSLPVPSAPLQPFKYPLQVLDKYPTAHLQLLKGSFKDHLQLFTDPVQLNYRYFTDFKILLFFLFFFIDN